MREAGFRTGAFVGAFVLDASFGLEQGFETYSGVASGVASADFLRPSDLQRPAAEVNALALRWIEALEGERFFAWIHYYDPHDPYAPPEDPSVRLQGLGYDREISYVDHCFGELVGHLERKGLLDRTMLVVAGDHGESLGSHGERKHGIFLYEPAVHVPFFVRAPGLVPLGRRYETPVSLVDVAPTVLSLLGLPPLQGIDGRSLWTPSGQLVAEQADRLVYGETRMPRIELGWSELAMIRDGRFKYVRAPRPELYDLSHDPTETTNLIETNREVASDLSEALDLTLSKSKTGAHSEAAKVLSPEELAKLQSLGYLQGSVGSATGAASGSLPDPKDRIAEASRLDEAEEHLERGELDAAIGKYEEVSRENRGNHSALQGRARALLRKGDLEKAEEAALAALAAAGADPQSPPPLADNARALLATTLSLRGRRAEAEKALRSTATLSPTSVLMAAAKNQDDAKAIVQSAIRRLPADPWTWAAMLEFSRRVGDREG
ncbi:MAG: sulfatase-like hydrolase/transferase, partial [Vicinamibacteria bacterium]